MRLTGAVIACAIKVHKTLGSGFLESVYEQALAIELSRSGINYRRQSRIEVQYQGQLVGEFVADFVVENELILELKAASKLNAAYESQMLNYLKATGMTIGLILNFGASKLQIRRLVNHFEDE